MIDVQSAWRLARLNDTASGRWSTIDPQTFIDLQNAPTAYCLRKQITIEEGNPRQQWTLHFAEWIANGSVWCNRKLIGKLSCHGGTLDLSMNLRRGMNELEIQLDAVDRNNALASPRQIYFPIDRQRAIGKIELQKVAVTRLAFVDCFAQSAGLLGTAIPVADVSGVALRIVCKLTEDGAEIATLKDTSFVYSNTIAIHFLSRDPFEAWTPEHPHHSELHWTLYRDGIEIETKTHEVAIRSCAISADRNAILVGGSPRQLKAITYWEPMSGTFDARRQTIDLQLEQLRRLFVNTIRLPYLPSEYLLDKCDQLGMMVMCEVPAVGLNAQAFDEMTHEYLDAASSLATLANAHPCIVAIGAGADNDDSQESVRKLYTSIARIAHNAGVLTYAVTRFAHTSFALDIAVLSTFGTNAESIGNSLERFAQVHRGKQPMLLIAGSLSKVDNKVFMGELASMNDASRELAYLVRETSRLGFAGIAAMTLTDYRSVTSISSPSSPYNLLTTGVYDLVTTGVYDPDQTMRPAGRMMASLYSGEGRIAPGDVPSESVSNIPFLVFGFLLTLVFFLLMNLDRRFREYVNRALMRPFNFFADIRDQRLIPNAQTAALGLILAGSYALVLGAMISGYHDHYSVAWIASMILPRPILPLLAYLAGHTVMMLSVATFTTFVAIICVALIIRFCAIFVRGRIFFADTFNLTCWALLPAIVLLPLGMLLPKLDHTAGTANFTFWLVVIVKLWIVYRLMKGIGVLFDIYPTRIYVAGTFTIAVCTLLVFVYLNWTVSFLHNWQFFIHLTKLATLQ